MKITRHAVDRKNLKRIFRYSTKELDAELEAARKRAINLAFLSDRCEEIYFPGSVVAPDAPEVPRALRLGAQAGAAIFATARAPEQFPVACPLGDGSPAVYTRSTHESSPNLFQWEKTFYLVVIVHEPDLMAVLRAIPYQLLMKVTSGGGELSYRFIDLLKAVWDDPQHFTRHPVFRELEAFCASGPGGAAPNKYVKRMTVPLLEVLRQLERKDEAGFNAALYAALEGHKAYWTSTAELRQLLDGLVSLPLTAIAALAHDRGLKVEVESDYLPRSWVTGELLRKG